MTKKSKRKFGSTPKDEVEKLKLQLEKLQLEEQIKNKEAEKKETDAKEEAFLERVEKVKDKLKKLYSNVKPEEASEEQVKAAETAKEEEEYKKKVEGKEGKVASTKIQRLFRRNKGRKILQDEKQHEEQETTLEELQKDFPESKEATLSFSSIDKVNKKLKDLLDHIKKYTIEESEETEELEKQQIEAEIELTKAETKQAIRESEQTSRFGMWRSDEEESDSEGTKKFGSTSANYDKKNQECLQKEHLINITTKQQQNYQKEYNNHVDLYSESTEILKKVEKYKEEKENMDDILKEYKKIKNDIISAVKEKKGVILSEQLELFSALASQLAVNKQLPDLGDELRNILQTYRLIDLLTVLNNFYTTEEDEEGTTLTTNINNIIKEINEKIEDSTNLNMEIGGKFLEYNHLNTTYKTFLGKAKDISCNEALKNIRKIDPAMESKINGEWSEIFDRKDNTSYRKDNTSYKYDQVIKMLLDCKESEFDEIRKRIQTVENSSETEDIHKKEIIMHGYTKNKLIKRFHNLKDTCQEITETNKISTFTYDEKQSYSFNMNKIYDKYKEVFNKYNEKKINEITNIHNVINDKIEGIKITIETVKGLKERLEDYKEEKKKADKKRNIQINNLKMEAESAIENFKKGEQIKVELTNYGYTDEKDFRTKQKQNNEKTYDFGKKIIKKILSYGLKKNKEYKEIIENAIRLSVKYFYDPDSEFDNKLFGNVIFKLQDLIMKSLPVKSIINLATFVKPPGKTTPYDTYTEGDLMGSSNMLESDGQTLTNQEENPTGRIMNILGKDKPYLNLSADVDKGNIYITDEDLKANNQISYKIRHNKKDIKLKHMKKVYISEEKDKNIVKTKKDIVRVMIKTDRRKLPYDAKQEDIDQELKKDGPFPKTIVFKNKTKNIENEELIEFYKTPETKGPFYKIFHTSNEEESKRQYKLDRDIANLIEDNNIQHITYAGYGFSGSGKTYTLIEGEKEKGYESVISQLVKNLTKRNIVPEINIYEHYKELYDDDCNTQFKFTRGKNANFTKSPIEHVTEGLTLEGLREKIKQVNEDRATTVHGKNFFRTTVRATSFNDQSSRSHMFVDLTFKVNSKRKKITVLDMAGAENVDAIQNDYFLSIPNWTIKLKGLKNEVEAAVTDITTISELKGYDKIYGKSGSSKSLKNITKYINNHMKEEITKKAYIINTKSWEGLFKNLTELGHKIEDEKDKFLDNYNNYQYYEILENIKDLYYGLKKLEETETEIDPFDRGYLGHNLGTDLTLNNLHIINGGDGYYEDKMMEVYNGDEVLFNVNIEVQSGKVIKATIIMPEKKNKKNKENIEYKKIVRLLSDSNLWDKTLTLGGKSRKPAKVSISLPGRRGREEERKQTYTNETNLRDFGICGFSSMIKLTDDIQKLSIKQLEKISPHGHERKGYEPVTIDYNLKIENITKGENLVRNYEIFYTMYKKMKPTPPLIPGKSLYESMESYFLNNTEVCYAFFKERNLFNLMFKQYLGDGYEIKNFNQIEKHFYTKDRIKLRALYSASATALIYKYSNMLKNLHKSCNNLLKYVEESTPQFKKAGVNVEALKNNFKGENQDDKEKLDDKAITEKITQKEKWDRTFITKYHCPLRFQGNYITKSIKEFQTNLKELNNNKKGQIDQNTFPYNILTWKGNNLTKKKFVIFTNIRLDFTRSLCKENLLYKSICDSYDDSILFSHNLLYSKDQDKTSVEDKEVDKILKNHEKVGNEYTLNDNVAIDERNRFGKKVSKKTSTRSFRKRGRRRAPSGIEIL